jgi:hypothetical protein
VPANSRIFSRNASVSNVNPVIILATFFAPARYASYASWVRPSASMRREVGKTASARS